MIEIKQMFEEDSFDICGYYSEGHINKEIFLEALLKHPKVINYLGEWQEEARPTITVDCIEHCWMSKDSNPVVRFDYEVVPLSLSTIGKPITFYEFWWVI